MSNLSRPNTVTPTCGIADACGGCSLIHETHAEQLRRKTARVKAAFATERELAEVRIEPCLPAPENFGYRNRAKLAATESSAAVSIGLYRRGSNHIVDLAPCVVERPVIKQGVEVVRRWLSEHRLARPKGPVMYVDLRETSGDGCHLTVVVGDASPHTEALPFAQLIALWPGLRGVALNYGNPLSSYPLGATTKVVCGSATFDATVSDEFGMEIEFAVPVGGFFQVATSLLPSVHRRMREHLGERELLYDLYCGVGVHGVMIRRGLHGPEKQVVGIEESAAACAAARQNAARHEVSAEYVEGRVEDTLAPLLLLRSGRCFVLNPGRAGCRPRVLEILAGVADARIAYLSCNAETLARDLAVLARSGFGVGEVRPLDLLPQTDHVETLALLARA